MATRVSCTIHNLFLIQTRFNMKKLRFLFVAWISLIVIVPFVLAQDDPAMTPETGNPTYDAGVQAFRQGQFVQAVASFEGVQESSKEYMDALYMLARIYAETELRSFSKAMRYLDRGLTKEPRNLRFLVAELSLIRDPENLPSLGTAVAGGALAEQVRRVVNRFVAKNWIQERLLASKARTIARQILEIDAKNAFANEELGITYIADYWRFRNAIALPGLNIKRHARFEEGSNPTSQDATNTNPFMQTGEGDDRQGSLTLPDFDQRNSLNDPFNGLASYISQRDILGLDKLQFNDQFDVRALESQGVNVKDLRGRADFAYRKAIEYLKTALQSDPMRRSVYTQMMKIYALKGDWNEASRLTDDMMTFFGEDANTYLYAGVAQYKLGNLERATQAFEQAQLRMSEKEMTSMADIGLLLPEREQAAYRADPVGYAVKYWTSQKPRFLTAWNERKLEHYFRMTYADLLYSAPKRNLRGWETQRGQILIRYGIPLVEVVMEKEGALSSRTDQNQIGNERFSTTDLGVQENTNYVSDMSDPKDVARLYNIWIYPEFRFVFEEAVRNGDYQFYTPSTQDIAYGVDGFANDYELRSKEVFRKYADLYTYKAPGRQVELPYLVNTFKGKSDHADVYVHAGVPIRNFDAKNPEIGLNLNVGTFLIGANRDFLVERRQTVYGMKSAQVVGFKDQNLWLLTQVMSSPPGAQTLSVEFETPNSGTVGVQRRSIRVPDYNGSEFMISDAMLAYNIAESPENRPILAGDVVRNGLSIRPAPWSVFGADRPVYIYFELYNLGLNAGTKTQYEVEAQLKPKDASRGAERVVNGLFGRNNRKGVSVKFTNGGVSKEDSQYLVLDAADQPEGLYTLVLRVKDVVSGKVVEKVKDLYLE